MVCNWSNSSLDENNLEHSSFPCIRRTGYTYKQLQPILGLQSGKYLAEPCLAVAVHACKSYSSENSENMRQTWAAAVRQSGGLVLHAVGIFFLELEDGRNAAAAAATEDSLGNVIAADGSLFGQAALEPRLDAREGENSGI